MIKLPLSFTALLIHAILSIPVAEVATAASRNQETNIDAQDYKEWRVIFQHPKPENDPFSLSCLIFKDLGCDIACYIMTDAFQKLGSGACDKNDLCVCNYAENPTLDGFWKEKFDKLEDFLQAIKTNELYVSVYMELAKPFRTGLEIKEALKKYLTESQYNQLSVVDTCPAMIMHPSLDEEIDSSVIEFFVDQMVSKVLKRSDEDLSKLDLKTNLNRALDRFKGHNDKFSLLVSEIRQVQNETMNRILDSYLIDNEIQASSTNKKNANEDNGSSGINRINIAEIISATITNKLVKKTEKSAFTNWVNWFGNKFMSFFTSRTAKITINDDHLPSFDNIYLLDWFKTPSIVDRNVFENSSVSVRRTWKLGGFILRYLVDKEGNIDFNWIKKPLFVSILKIGKNVNQNWVFGTEARINMARNADGSKGQTWDFETKTYEYFKMIDSAGNEHADEKWSNGEADVKSLERFQSYMKTWCEDNEFLVDKEHCIIF